MGTEDYSRWLSLLAALCATVLLAACGATLEVSRSQTLVVSASIEKVEDALSGSEAPVPGEWKTTRGVRFGSKTGFTSKRRCEGDFRTGRAKLVLEQEQEATSCQIRGELGTSDFDDLVELLTARLDDAGLEWERESVAGDE